jgi:hypothetical protein
MLPPLLVFFTQSSLSSSSAVSFALPFVTADILGGSGDTSPSSLVELEATAVGRTGVAVDAEGGAGLLCRKSNA